MAVKQLPIESSDLQNGISKVALSLDAFLINGIQYSVLVQAGLTGLLTKTASNLIRDLDALEELISHVPSINQGKALSLLENVKSTSQELIQLVTGLIPFRSIPVPQWLPHVAEITQLRDQCVQQITDLETCLQTGEAFYSSRSSDSTTSVEQFLGDLENFLMREWNKANKVG